MLSRSTRSKVSIAVFFILVTTASVSEVFSARLRATERIWMSDEIKTFPAAGEFGKLLTGQRAFDDPVRNAPASTFVVNSNGDQPDVNPGNGICEITAGGGVCTLRAAIQEANAHANGGPPDQISFNITGFAGVVTIVPASLLPPITDPLIIDGYTQPGSSPNTLANNSNAVLMIQIAGTGLPNNINQIGLQISSDNCVIRGLFLNGFTFRGEAKPRPRDLLRFVSTATTTTSSEISSALVLPAATL